MTKKSSSLKVNFGVPQGSIMGPLFFNIYVADLQSTVTNRCHQYAHDITLYAHAKPIQLHESISSIKSDLTKLEDWADKCNLAINPTKTKCMVISTKQMSTAHSLDHFKPDLSINGITIERVSSMKLLGTHIDQHLCWEENIKQVLSSCYATLATLRKLKNILPFNMRKTLVQALVLSKLYFRGIIYHNLLDYLANHLQRVQKASASFILGHFVSIDDITNLKWLPIAIKEQFQWLLLKAVHKAIRNPTWPSYLKVDIVDHTRT